MTSPDVVSAAPPTISPDFYTVAARYAAKYRDKTVVIKFGGELVAQDDVIRNLMVQAITLKNFGARVVLVHGGGTQIDEELKRAGIEPKKTQGVRDTDMATLEVTHRCLNELNRRIVNLFHEEAFKLGADVNAIGLGGNDLKLITAKPRFEESRTGTLTDVDSAKLSYFTAANSIPVIHPISMGQDGTCMNVNADEVAAGIAIALGAQRLILCSNVKAVLDKDKNRISHIYTDNWKHWIEDGTVNGGMIPKVEAAIEVASHPAVGGVVILDGADKQAIEKELLTDEGAGTLFLRRAVGASPSAAPNLSP